MSNWFPLVSTIVGALAALVGTALSHYLQARRDAERHSREISEQRLQDLKGAYAEWFGAQMRLVNTITVVALTKPPELTGLELITRINSEIAITGTRIRLTEQHDEARKKTGEMLSALATLVAKTSIELEEPQTFLTEISEFSRRLGEFETWLVNERLREVRR